MREASDVVMIDLLGGPVGQKDHAFLCICDSLQLNRERSDPGHKCHLPMPREFQNQVTGNFLMGFPQRLRTL